MQEKQVLCCCFSEEVFFPLNQKNSKENIRAVLGCVDTKPKTHLFGRILRILRRENLPGDSPPAFPLLVCAEILLKNLHSILVSTHPR